MRGYHHIRGTEQQTSTPTGAMAFKFFLLAALVAIARAGVAPVAYSAPALAHPVAVAHPAQFAYGAPVAKAVVAAPGKAVAVDTDFDPNPQYSFSYDIQDALTGDSKSQHETRNGDVVEGSYSLVEPDGTRRIVDYTADPVNGFNAVVHKEGAATVVKAPVAAPVVTKVATPVAYHAPVAAYHAPVTAYHAPAQIAYHASAPVAYHAPAPVAYHAGPAVAYHAPAQLTYASPAYGKFIG
ncbi:larval cuticle protein A3A-like [Ischnura elegans]|uniref:larval cuticle protein A3A-like n=1 Tax=Ischnura elegans TaxID=197161 RepID=UPI001ED88E27|nr:larval cuticle protein A3A-like [Ischnura elegans]